MRIFNARLISSQVEDSRESTSGAALYKAPLTISASLSSSAVNLSHIYGWSLTAVTSGTLTGSLALYCSNDAGDDRLGTGVVNWTLIDGTSTAVTGSSNTTYNLQLQFYKWAQFRYTHTAGTGTLDVNATGKGSNQ